MSILILEPGESTKGDHQTIRSDGPIETRGDHNEIYTNHSEIRGDYNSVYGDGNVIRGSYNKIYGKDNLYKGDYNVSSDIQGKPVPQAKTVQTFFPKYSFQNQVSPYGSSLTIPYSSPSTFVRSVIVPEEKKEPMYPTEEEVKYDEAVNEKDEDNACVVCMEKKPKCVVRPCKHFCLCVGCSTKKFDKCPVCRVVVASIERLFT